MYTSLCDEGSESCSRYRAPAHGTAQTAAWGPRGLRWASCLIAWQCVQAQLTAGSAPAGQSLQSRGWGITVRLHQQALALLGVCALLLLDLHGPGALGWLIQQRLVPVRISPAWTIRSLSAHC